jgi:UDP:flavonoid glycosyltransferase YjiC (YdhE family)
LGDIYPFIAVGRELLSRGRRPIVAAWKAHRGVIEDAGLEFCPLSPDLDSLPPDLRSKAMHPQDGPALFFERLIFPYLQQNFDQLREVCTAADLVVAHNSAYVGHVVAEKLNLKWLSVFLQPLTFFSRFDPPVLPSNPLCARFGPNARWVSIAGMGFARRSTLPFFKPMQLLRERVGLPPSKRHPVFDAYSPWGNMAWFSRAFASRQLDWPRRTEITGFPEHDGATAIPAGLDRFLENGDPPVVFTLGHSAQLSPGTFFEESVKIAKQLRLRAVFAGGIESPLPPGDPDFFHAKYIRYSHLFPAARLVVNAGGIGTIAAVLRAGKPMIVVPFAHDQPDNAHHAARLGVARVVPADSYRADVVAPLIEQLVSDPKAAKKSAELARKIAAENGAANACRFIERYIE